MTDNIEAEKSSKHFLSRNATPKKREYTSEQLSLVKRIRACKDYYEILSLNKNATLKEIKNSYRKIALKLHPDKNGAPGAEEAFKAVVNAMAVLTDITKRINYDLYENGKQDERIIKSSCRRPHTKGFDEPDVSPDEFFNAGYGLRSKIYARRGQRWQRKADDNEQQHSDTKQNQNAGLLTSAEILIPILMVILLAMVFGYYFISDPSYNLFTSEKYWIIRRTYNLQVPYYVKDSYYSEYQGLLNRFDLSVEEDFVSSLRDKCYSEKCFRKCFFYVFYSFRLGIFYLINTILKFLHVLDDDDNNILPALF